MGKKRRRSTRQGTWISNNFKYVALVVVGAFAVFLTVLAFNRPVEVTAYEPPRTTNEAPAPTPEKKLPKVAFIGDSWAGGAGTPEGGAENSYAGLAGRELGWPYSIHPGGGTGYTKDNPAGEGRFIDRVDAAVAESPDIVVVQGSSNDYLATQATIEQAANETFAKIRAALPDAKIYVVGVADSPSAPVDKMNQSRAAVAAAAATNGVTFIDSQGWLDLATDFADGYHPNEQGHQKVATQLAAALKQ